ncbi:serine protease 53-like [Neocloeon triangulifer]|uniref:serine protease 53-like n=1 Tax=Neocloeon triangulifer TaxID=2078957 RepID=UPI00286ED53E|nr:serine protease 53-like [Neocloeon triangulifer]
MWKSAIAILALLALSEAVDWSAVRPAFRVKSSPLLRKAYNKKSSKIIGGSLATAGQFPYIAAVLNNGVEFCGGVLISDYTVLTAAHCTTGGVYYEVILGALNYNNAAEPGRLVVTATKVRVHQAYDDFTLANDIAVIEFDSRINLTSTIQTARLPGWSQNGLKFEDIPARTAGWGWTYEGENAINPDLLYVDVTTIYDDLCLAYYGNLYDASQICIDTSFGTAGTCNSDAGGPLVIVDSDGLDTVIGIANYVADDGCEGVGPQGFARLSGHLDWLEVNGGVIIRESITMVCIKFLVTLCVLLAADIKAFSINERIIGGTVALSGQFPYQAGVFIDETRFCGGSLISPQYVLTAAHCIHNANRFEIHLGNNERTNLNEPGLFVDVTFDKIVHENFDIVGSKNDIALLRLTAPVSQPNIVPILLPTWSQANSTLEGKIGRLSGWGTIDDTIPYLSESLRYVDLLVVPIQECQITFNEELVTECHICVSSDVGTKGFCSGDTGGALAFENDSLEWQVQGVSSFGHPFACENAAPQVYVRLTCYLQWIADNSDIIINN